MIHNFTLFIIVRLEKNIVVIIYNVNNPFLYYSFFLIKTLN